MTDKLSDAELAAAGYMPSSRRGRAAVSNGPAVRPSKVSDEAMRRAGYGAPARYRGEHYEDAVRESAERRREREGREEAHTNLGAGSQAMLRAADLSEAQAREGRAAAEWNAKVTKTKVDGFTRAILGLADDE